MKTETLLMFSIIGLILLSCNTKLKILIILFFMINSIVLSQETNYWFHNFGAISSLKGGIESGGISNPAAIYYNPGALAFMDGDFFDGQADVISLDVINVKNAGGDQVDLNSILFGVSPSIFVYSQRFKKHKNLTYSLGAITRYNSNYSFDLEHEQTGNYLLPNDKVDVFQGHYHYDNRVREGWLMGAISYKINEKVGLGMSANFFVRSQDYYNTYKAKAFRQDELGLDGQFSKITSNDDEKKLNYRSMGFIFKPGFNFNFDPLKLGLTITTPALHLGLLNNRANRSQLSILPDEDQKIYSESDAHSFYQAVYKTPFSINIGAEYQFNKLSVAISSEWFAPIDKYELIREKNNSENMKYPTTDDPKYAIPVMANKSILNFGFSVMYNIKESWSYIGSFRTDFNYFDANALDRNKDFVPSMNYWDVYHITSGMIFSIKNAQITFGFDYGYGRSENDSQFVNMTTASQSNFLRGDIQNNTSTRFHNIGVSIGLSLNLTQDKQKI